MSIHVHNKDLEGGHGSSKRRKAWPLLQWIYAMQTRMPDRTPRKQATGLGAGPYVKEPARKREQPE